MAMDRQQLEAALSLLLDQMENEAEDQHEIYQRLMQILSSMRATGMPLPDDLVRLEREMEEQFGRDAGGGEDSEKTA